ncbi:MAG: hypothetical protein LBI47_01195 [Puniceicoccales bacterium]|nr:hypothetical protein [Puniceicoccales bacterium]
MDENVTSIILNAKCSLSARVWIPSSVFVDVIPQMGMVFGRNGGDDDTTAGFNDVGAV